MLAIERRNEILAKLQVENKVLVSDLSQHYQVTEETIRRDLEKLEQEGLAKKTYGGAIFCDNVTTEIPYNIRKEANVKEKQKIASMIADMIHDGERIMLDSSSTALYVAKTLKTKKGIIVITNSVEILLELSDKPDVQVLCTGGTMKEGALAMVGQQAEKMIDHFFADVAVISCKGIDLEFGLTDSNEPDVQIKEHYLKQARHKILAIDSSKFNRKSFVRMGALSVVDTVVTDKKPDEQWMEAFEQSQNKLYYET